MTELRIVFQACSYLIYAKAQSDQISEVVQLRVIYRIMNFSCSNWSINHTIVQCILPYPAENKAFRGALQAITSKINYLNSQMTELLFKDVIKSSSLKYQKQIYQSSNCFFQVSRHETGITIIMCCTSPASNIPLRNAMI